jgi:hypothetical protein
MKMKISMSLVTAMLLLFVGCDQKLDVHEISDFTISAMPVPKSIRVHETVEIRFQLNRNDMHEDAKYNFDYFQSESKGMLLNEKGILLIPNETYALESERFRLYYFSTCLDLQEFDITVHDNHNQVHKLSFSFTNNSEHSFPF